MPGRGGRRDAVEAAAVAAAGEDQIRVAGMFQQARPHPPFYPP